MKGLSMPKIEDLIRLYAKYLKPKFYNKVTWLLVFAGVSLISTPLFERVLEAILKKTINLDLTDGKSWLYGLTFILFGLSYNLLSVYLDGAGRRFASNERSQKLSAHDLRIFEKLNDVLSEEQVLRIVDAIATNHMFRKDQKAKIEDYYYLAVETQHRYLIEEIEKANIEYLGSIGAFCSFLSQHFFYSKHESTMEFLYLYPDLNPDRGTDLTERSEEIYFQRSEELNEVAVNLERKAKDYRKKIKEVLYV